MVDSAFLRKTVDEKWVTLLEQVEGAYIAAAKDELDPQVLARIGMHRVNAIKRILESSKVEHAIARTRELISEGKQAIIFVETKADRRLGRFRTTGSAKGQLYAYPEMLDMMENADSEAPRGQVGGGPSTAVRAGMAIARDARGRRGLRASSVVDEIRTFRVGCCDLHRRCYRHEAAADKDSVDGRR